MLADTLRLQLADTSVHVAGLVAPSVMTGLIPGQDDSGAAMPLDDFFSEVDALVENQPPPTKILANASSSCATARLAATAPP